MSELKVYHCNEWHNEYTEFYMKSEADKVIAENDKKTDLYRRGWEESDRINALLYAELRNQKYNRCMDNAWWCRKLSNAYTWDACNHRGWKIAGYYDKKAELYRKWRKRWLKIAEKFKEAK